MVTTPDGLLRVGVLLLCVSAAAVDLGPARGAAVQKQVGLLID